MSSDKEFENVFRRLEETTSEVPGDMWRKIRGRMTRRERLIIFSSCLVVILSCLVALIYYNSQESSSAHLKTIDHDPKSKVDHLGTGSDSSLINSNTIIFSQNNFSIKIIDARRYKPGYNNEIQPGLQNTDSLSAPGSANTSKYLAQENFHPPADSIKSTTHQNLNKTELRDDSTGESNPEYTTEVSDDKFSLAAFVSPDIPFQKLTYFDSTTSSSKDKKSVMRFSYSIGARIQYKIGPHFMAGIGVTYAWMNNKNGSFKTSYKMLDVPLFVGYTVQKESYSIAVNAGISLNINAKHTSNGIEKASYPYNLQTNEAYKRSAGISYYGSLNFSVPVDEKLNFFAEPYFKYHPSNIVNPIQPFRQNINTLGVGLGVRYDLFKKNDE